MESMSLRRKAESLSLNTLTAVVSEGPKECSAWFEDLPGVYGAGSTIEEAKVSLLEGLRLFIKNNPAPSWLRQGKYEISYHVK